MLDQMIAHQILSESAVQVISVSTRSSWNNITQEVNKLWKTKSHEKADPDLVMKMS